MKLDPDPQKCGSAVRSAYADSFADAIHPNCSGDKDLSNTHKIMHVSVSELPQGLEIDPPTGEDRIRWDIFPHHDPIPACFAHSTICCCTQDAPRVAVTPPKSVRKQFREQFAAALKPSDTLA